MENMRLIVICVMFGGFVLVSFGLLSGELFLMRERGKATERDIAKLMGVSVLFIASLILGYLAITGAVEGKY